MKRSNSFEVIPQTDADEACLRRLLDASASLWNEVTYARRQRFAGDRDGTVWDADTGTLEGRYKGVVGSATAQQVIGKQSEAWRSFFSLNEKYHDPDDESVTETRRRPATGATKTTAENCEPTFARTATRWTGASEAALKSQSASS